MTEIIKKLSDKYLVIIDTNIIFSSDKANVVSPDFDKFWSRHISESNLKLYIPEVVKGEIIYQQTTSAIKTLERTNKSIENLSSYTDSNYNHRITEGRIRKDVCRRFQKWIKLKKAEEIKSPIENIPWDSIIHNSIWRLPPFSIEDSEKDKTEKGFRDSIILETVINFSQNHCDSQIIFLCNDSLLRKTAESRLSEIDTFSVYESVEDFESYLRLINERSEEKFVKSIIRKAKQKFFKKGDKSTLIYKAKVAGLIKEKYSEEISSPEDCFERNSADEDSIIDFELNKLSRGALTVDGQPQFIKIANKNTFYWNSLISYQAKYGYNDVYDFEGHNYIEYIYKIEIIAQWKVNVSSNSVFTKMELVGIELDNRDVFEI